MKSRHRPASDGDEQEGEESARPDRAIAIHELRHGMHFERWRHDDDADGKRGDGADLEKGRQIIARCQQQPHRQHRCHCAIADQDPAQLHRREGEDRPP